MKVSTFTKFVLTDRRNFKIEICFLAMDSVIFPALTVASSIVLAQTVPGECGPILKVHARSLCLILGITTCAGYLVTLYLIIVWKTILCPDHPAQPSPHLPVKRFKS